MRMCVCRCVLQAFFQRIRKNTYTSIYNNVSTFKKLKLFLLKATESGIQSLSCCVRTVKRRRQRYQSCDLICVEFNRFLGACMVASSPVPHRHPQCHLYFCLSLSFYSELVKSRTFTPHIRSILYRSLKPVVLACRSLALIDPIPVNGFHDTQGFHLDTKSTITFI